MNLSRSATLPILRRVVLFGTLALPPTVSAEETARLETPKSAQKAGYSTQPICKRQAVIGTKISKSVCKTRAQMDAERAESRDLLEDIHNSATIQTTTMD